LLKTEPQGTICQGRLILGSKARFNAVELLRFLLQGLCDDSHARFTHPPDQIGSGEVAFVTW
jgi:hypothetical protein